MFSVFLDRLDPEAASPFPLYVFLEKNDRMVPIRLVGDSLGRKLFDELRSGNKRELWVPKDFQVAYDAYASYLDKTRKPASVSDEAPPDPTKETKAPEDTGITLSFPSANEAGDLLRGFAKDETRAGSFLEDASLRYRNSVDALLEIAGRANPLYLDVLAMRSIQAPTEHSVFVGSLSGLIAAAAVSEEPEWIANLVTAATLHDIGIAAVGFDPYAKPRSEWTSAEKTEYERHVDAGTALLKRCDPALPEEVLRIVGEHHERADGTGFPRGLRADRLHRGALILAVADRLDRLLLGAGAGETLKSPAAAVSELRAEAQAGAYSLPILDKAFGAS
jgi:hypothetical protein